MLIPLNIFFYWDIDIPDEVTKNIDNFKKNNMEYNVILLSDDDINKYKNDFSELINLFHLSTIAALKSDIIRMIFLYKEGGLWLDSNTILIDNDGVKKLFEQSANFDTVITVLPHNRNDLKTSAIISKPNSKLLYDNILLMTKNLLVHYENEKTTTEYIPYNYFMFIAPVTFYQLLEYTFDDNFRNEMGKIIKQQDSDIINVNMPKFNNYNCALMIVDKYLRFYGCNMEHHHGKNFHKHWSNIQKTQRLFK
jgi:hypothetical protein